MRKLVALLIVGTLAVLAFGKDFKTVYADKTFVIGDTAIWTDTFLGDWVGIDGATDMQFYVNLASGVRPGTSVEDTNFGADSFFVNIQFSFDKNTVAKTLRLDTLLDNGTAWTGADISSDSIVGDWMRPMLIWRDTTNVDSAVTFGRTFGKKFNLYYTLQK